jgi:hypothetical protein
MSEDRAGYTVGKITELGGITGRYTSARNKLPPPPNRTIDQYGAAVEPSITAKEIRRIGENYRGMAKAHESGAERLWHNTRAKILEELADLIEMGAGI